MTAGLQIASRLRIGFLLKLTQIFDEAGAAARFARDTGISAVQDKPVMRV